MGNFNGFPKGCIPFLNSLAKNNDRAWFNENKTHYESKVREPAMSFIEAMGPRLITLSPNFTAIPKKVGGSLMRVYRDTRFSKDKSPYKTNIGIQFRHELGKDVHAPGFYVHIEPSACFLGVGIWHPESKVLSRIRDFMIDNPNGWRQAVEHSPFSSNYVLEGESLKRSPKGYPADHELIDDLKRKDFIACMNFPDQKITLNSFPDYVIQHFEQADPFMSYLCMAVGVRY